MTEELLRQYAAMRAHKLMLNGAQTWNFTNRVLQHWLSGAQAETAMKEAAREVGK